MSTNVQHNFFRKILKLKHILLKYRKIWQNQSGWNTHVSESVFDTHKLFIESITNQSYFDNMNQTDATRSRKIKQKQ